MKKRFNTLVAECLAFMSVMFMTSVAIAQCPNTGPLTCSDPNSTSAILFFEDWENDNAQGWTGDIDPTPAAPTGGFWIIPRTGGTTSAGTGPLSADCGTKYAYWETSGGTPPVDLNFPSPFCLVNATDAELSFYWHAATPAAGIGDAVVNVQASIDGGANWTTLYTITSGDTPTQADPFTLESVDLTPFVGNQVMLRFNGALDTRNEDIAIDNIQVQACLSSTTCSDPAPPVITACPSVPSPVSTDATTCSAFIDFPVLQFTDGCPGVIVKNDLNGTDNADGVYNPGTYTINWTVTDSDCNVSTCQTNLEVVDLVPPVLNCPADMTISLDPGLCCTAVDFEVTVTDNCPFIGPAMTLNTINAPNNGNSAGGIVCFDLENNSGGPMVISEMSSSIDGPTMIDVYTKAGTAQGFEQNVGAFTLTATGDATAGPFTATPTPFAVNFNIPAGTTGVCLHVVSTTSNYTNGNGGGGAYGTSPNGNYDDGTLAIRAGATSNNFFAAAPFNPRIWNGGVTYQVGGGEAEVVQTMGEPSGTELCADPGIYTNTFESVDANGNIGTCSFNVTVEEYQNATQNLTCNDNVQISLDQNCEITVGADMVLEGGPYGCYDTRYTVHVLGPLGNIVPQPLGPGSIGKEYVVKVIDNQTNQLCWGNIHVKDKLAPVIECGDLVLDCNADLNDPEILKPAPFISQPAAPFQVPQNILPHGGGAITVAGNALPGGFLFDLQNLAGTPILITSVDVRFGDIQFGAVTSPTPVSVYVTTTSDTWNGNQLDPNAWINVVFEEPVIVAGQNSEFSNVSLGAGLTLAPGEKRGVFVFGVNNSVLYDGGGTSTLTPFTDGNLELISGVSLGGLFSGASFGPPRTPNIVFHYEERLDGVDPYDNCGTFTLTHFDDFVDGSCGGPSGVMTRTWTATDNSGNSESCTQTITLSRPSVADIEIPGNIKWTCIQYDIFPNITDPTAVHPYIVDCDAASELLDATCYSASCDDLDFSFQDNAGINSTTTGGGCPGLGLDDADVLALTGSGEPTVDGRPLISICEIGVEHEDIIVQECVGTFKIVRQWTIIDWCSNPIAVRQENQIIKVVDDEAPIIELFGVDGNTNSAYGNNLIPALGNLGNPSTTGGCGQAPQNTGGTVFTALVQLPGTGNQFNPDQFTNISLESVLLTINHQQVEDLDIFLKGPSNKVIELTSDNGINGIGYHKTKFVDDTSVPVISNGVNSPFTGKYRPEGTFDISCGGFNGTVSTLADMTSNWQADVLGTWELIVFDDHEDNIGELVEWKLNFSFGDVTLDVYDATATGSVHTICEGSVLVPPIQDCLDNCSGVDHYITELWTINGGAPEYQIGTINGNGGYFSNVPLFVNGLPARYIVRYYAVDGCKNQSSLDMNVRLRDRVPPVAICDEITEIALTNNGQNTGSSCSRLYPEDLDDGSYDNCSPIYFLMAKMDDSFSQDIYNRCYYPWRDFCCEDVGTQTVIVMVLDQDPTPLYNTTITSAALGCDKPTPNFPSLFLSPNGINATIPGTQQLVPVNFNTCMVTVEVSEKLPPVLINCPGNERISCDLYASNFEIPLAEATTPEEECAILGAYFGNAEYFDNCVANVTCTVSYDLDQCLEGTVRRTWTATDGAGNTNSSQNCNQTIFVDHVSDFVVEFPQHRNGEPTHLPPVECGEDVPDFGEPEIFYETCELVAVSYEDEIFTDEPGACYKILRQWTVINWCVVGDQIDQEVVEESELAMRLSGCLSIINFVCDLDGDGDCDDRTFRDSWRSCNLPDAAEANNQFGPDTDPDFDPWDGFITYQQQIKVNDTVDPVFTNGCEIPDVCITDNTCGATVLLPTPSIDECSPNPTFTYQITIGGSVQNGAGPYLNVAPGQYPVRYVVADNCNNQTACETILNVRDCKKPTPYCKNGIIVELMVVDPAMVQVWATDLNDNSFDNCPGPLKFSFSADVNDIGVTFTCDDRGQNPVELWVTDAAGNQDFCITTVIIQANMDQCDDDTLSVSIAGQTATEYGDGVQDVTVNINSPSGFGASVATDANGTFFQNVPAGDYTVTPVHDVDPLNGVTTFDLVKISKHILGVELLDSPYKMIAADANKSNSITTFDLVQIRKLILFINTDLPNNTSWRFVDKAYAFNNPANPFAENFPEVINLNNLSIDKMANDFVAIKVGDVNGSAAVNFASAEDRNMVGDLVLNTDDAVITEGQTYTVEFKATEFAVSGYQFTLNFDNSALAFNGIVPGLADESNFGLTMVNEGVITTSWNSSDVKTLATDEVVFGLTFTAKQGGRLSDLLNVNSRYTVAEAYTAGAELLNVALSFNNAQVAGGFELYQNTPNPFATTTIIGFYLPEATSATLTISDVQGKVVKVIEKEFVKGYNQETLKRSELGATGVMYYRLDTDTDSATRMMILVD